MSKKHRGDEAEYVPGSNRSSASDPPSLFAELPPIAQEEALNAAFARSIGAIQAGVNRVLSNVEADLAPPWHREPARAPSPTLPHYLSRAYARDSDPAPSAEAADRATLKMTPARRAVLECFFRHEFTDEQLIQHYFALMDICDYPLQTASGIRSRRAELVKIGHVVKRGIGKSSAGNPSTIWGMSV